MTDRLVGQSSPVIQHTAGDSGLGWPAAYEALQAELAQVTAERDRYAALVRAIATHQRLRLWEADGNVAPCMTIADGVDLTVEQYDLLVAIRDAT